jgi:hypothetical protein
MKKLSDLNMQNIRNDKSLAVTQQEKDTPVSIWRFSPTTKNGNYFS